MDAPRVSMEEEQPPSLPSSPPPSTLASFLDLKNLTWKQKLVWFVGVLGLYLIICYILVIIDAFSPSNDRLSLHGVLPRTVRGLVGIISGPFLHIGFKHMFADTFGVSMMGGFLMLSSIKEFFLVTSFVWPTSTFFTWCVARSGASVVGSGFLCFGWFGYLVAKPFFQRPISPKAIAIAAVVGILYGAAIFAIFKGNENVSWEGCLASLFAGLICGVGYWYLGLILLPQHFVKFQQFKKRVLTPSSPSFQKEDPQKGAVILPQPPTPQFTALPPKSSLLADDRNSPFGNHDSSQQVQQQPYPNSFEPAWLYDTPSPSSTSSTSSPSYPPQPQPQPSSNFLIPPSQNNQNQQFNPFDTPAPPPSNNSNNNASWFAPPQPSPYPPPQSTQVTFNPFD